MLSGKTIFFIEFKCEIVLVQQTALNQKSIYLKNGMITNHKNVMINQEEFFKIKFRYNARSDWLQQRAL